MRHVGVEESYLGLSPDKSYPYDYFHINSISEAPDGNLIVSARNTWAIYKLDRSTGEIIWRMNGKLSDFKMGPGAHFYWQHDARMPSPTSLTVFDDGSPTEEKQSRALLLSVNDKSLDVGFDHAYTHPARLLATNQGSVQLLPDGRVFVGWGNQPYFSEFASDGTLLLDGEFAADVDSYRAFTYDWVGRPGGASEHRRTAELDESEPNRLRKLEWGHGDKHLGGARRHRQELASDGGIPGVDRLRNRDCRQFHGSLLLRARFGLEWQRTGPLKHSARRVTWLVGQWPVSHNSNPWPACGT